MSSNRSFAPTGPSSNEIMDLDALVAGLKLG